VEENAVNALEVSWASSKTFAARGDTLVNAVTTVGDHGVPMVMAGATEDKVETTRRVEWSGTGVNLRSGRPTEEQIAAGVDRVLIEPKFRERARGLQDEIAAAPGMPGLERIVTELVASKR
jgi:UDP:flavonoid glycosyltransferase YjiC (YdhE family)